jgi:glutamyl-tRNA reductase
MKAREAGPTIALLQQHLETLALSELERTRSRLGELSPAQLQALESYARSLMHKIAHGPITELRHAAAHEHGEHTASLIRRIFRLED